MAAPDIKKYISDTEAKYGLPSGLLHGVAHAESRYDQYAVSPKGAIGMFQFMPGTARAYRVNPWDPYESADGAGRMMREMLDRYNGSVDHALAAYNWGSGRVSKYGIAKMPTETTNYIQKVKANMGGEVPNTVPTSRNSGNVQPSAPPMDAIMRSIKNFVMPGGKKSDSSALPYDSNMTAAQPLAGASVSQNSLAGSGFNGATDDAYKAAQDATLAAILEPGNKNRADSTGMANVFSALEPRGTTNGMG